MPFSDAVPLAVRIVGNRPLIGFWRKGEIHRG
jgi:hypothetical protein